MNILIAFLALNFIILAHEFGHFVVAKAFGMKVLEFSLFVGPKIFSFQKGETTYSLRLLPILAYVRLEGEEEASDDERSFNKKPVGARAAVIAAGPLMNLLVAILLLTIVFTSSGFDTNIITSVQDNSPAYISALEDGDKIVSYDGKAVYTSMDFFQFLFISKGEPADIEIIRDGERISKKLIPEIIPGENRYMFGFTVVEPTGDDSNLILEISAGMPADTAGLKPGDRIVQIGATPVSSKQEIDGYMRSFGGGTVQVKILRDGSTLTREVSPKMVEYQDSYYAGFSFDTVEKGSFFKSLGHSFAYTLSVVKSVGYSIIWLIQGKVSLKDLMGPVGMVSTIGAVVQQSRASLSMLLLNLFNVTAMFSIALGATNLIPFPALDGSKLLLLGVEAIRRKPLPVEKESIISVVGMIILLLLAAFTFYNDIVRLIFG